MLSDVPGETLEDPGDGTLVVTDDDLRSHVRAMRTTAAALPQESLPLTGVTLRVRP